MESEDEQKEVEIKNHTCYYFDFIMRFLVIFCWTKSYIKHMKILWFMTFHTKLLCVQNHFVFGSKKFMDLLKFMIELDI